MNKYDVAAPEVLGMTGARMIVECLRVEKAPGTYTVVSKGNQVIIRCNVKKTADALQAAFTQAMGVIR